ncbi:MAG: hypothetical protein QM741_08915 [Rudaea sp.]|uniref:hypothetical protein n=1 Tax=Rudaea sp. TaxID=2136325 RepID=UPI0039E6EFAE
MRPTLFIASLPLILAGCNYAPSTSITTTTVNGADVLDSAIHESTPGETRFTCNESATGNCYYALFTSDCHSDAKDTSICTTHRLADFALARGESKSLNGLPSGYKHCVARTKPVPPQCAEAPQG